MAAPILSIAEANFGGIQTEKADCVLVDLAPGSDERDRLRSMRLQYWPDSISDSKGVNFSPKDIPGGSLPVYQWISSGERTIGFTTVFTSDIDPVALIRDTEDPIRTLRSEGALQDNVDIRSAITWLRRFTLPSYGKSTGTLGDVIVRAPRKLLLSMKNSGIGLYGGAVQSGLGPLGGTADSIVCLMTQCEVTFEAFFPSGAPRIASVSLAFAQTPQYAGHVEFPGVTPQLEQVVSGDGDRFGYKLGATGLSSYDIDPPIG